MSQLILNDHTVDLPPDDVNLLDFLREAGLTSAKPGCRGGDCGACQVLLGELAPGESQPHYRTVNTCLLTTGLVAGCHLITTEGLNADRLTPVQQALVDLRWGPVRLLHPGPGGRDDRRSPGRGAHAGGGRRQPLPLHRIRRHPACLRLARRRLSPAAPRSLAEAADLGLLPAPVAAAGAGLTPSPWSRSPRSPGSRCSAARPTGRSTTAAPGRPRPVAPAAPGAQLRGITAGDGTLTIGAAVTVAEHQGQPARGR